MSNFKYTHDAIKTSHTIQSCGSGGYAYHLGKYGSVSSTYTFGPSFDNVTNISVEYNTRYDITTPAGTTIKGIGNGVFPQDPGSISSTSYDWYKWREPGARIGMGVGQGGSIMATDYAAAKALGYGVKGYYALKQSRLTTSSFNLHPRLTNLNTAKYDNLDQFNAGHRGTAFFSDEILQTGKIGTKDFNSIIFGPILKPNTIHFNKTIGGKDLSVGLNPWNNTIFHQGPDVFK